MVDIPADDHDRSDFTNTAAKASERGREKRAAAIPEECFDALGAGCIERNQQVMILGPEIADGLMRDAGDERREDDDLGDDHGPRCKEQPHDAEGARARQQKIHDKANDHRGQPHERIEQRYDKAAKAVTRDSEPRAERQANKCCKRHSRACDKQRARRDLVKIGVKCDDQPEGGCDALPDFGHGRSFSSA